MSSVPTFKLSDGTLIPAIGWGNGTGDAKKTAIESGAFALKAGLRHIDTAQGYDNEVETGKSVINSKVDRSQVYVTTKLSQSGGDPAGKPLATADVRASVLGTIERLGFQPNLLLIHNPFLPESGQLVPFWQELEKLKDSGELTASLGISNFRPQDIEELMAAAKHKPVVNQLEYHPYVLSHLEPVLALGEKYDIRVEAYGPLSPLLRHKTGGPIKPILARIAKRLSSETGKDIDEAAALLLWIRSKGVVAITASGNEGRIAKLAETQTLPDLSSEEVKEIEEAGKKVYFRAYDEHMKHDFPAPDQPSDL